MMDTFQVHTQNSQRMAQNYIRWGLVMANPTKLGTFYLYPIEVKHTYWYTSHLCPSYLHVIKCILCSWAINLVYRSGIMWLIIVHKQHFPAFPEMISPWASWAYRLEAFLLYRSLKHENLNLQHNFSPHKCSTGYKRSLLS